MLSVAIDLCKNIIDYLRNENQLRLEDKLRVSMILNEISDILLDTSNKLKLDEYPHYNCVLMEKLANDLHFRLIDHIKPDELDKLHSVLMEASQIEKQYTWRKDPQTIPSIEKAAAEFKSFSILMKV